jgi:hypothetical protein
LKTIFTRLFSGLLSCEDYNLQIRARVQEGSESESTAQEMTHHMDLIGKKHEVRITTHRQAKKPNHRISHRRIRDLLATKALIKNQFSKSQCGHIR